MLLAPPVPLAARAAHQSRHHCRHTNGRPLRCTAVATPTLQATPSTRTAARTPCHVRIGGEWKDLTAWAAAHPAGSHWIVDYHGRDATDVFFAFHSTEARAALKRLPPLRDAAAAAALEATTAPCSREQRAFRELRSQLEADGWFDRSVAHEVCACFHTLPCCDGASVHACIVNGVEHRAAVQSLGHASMRTMRVTIHLNLVAQALQLATWAACLGAGLAMAHSGSSWLQALACLPLGMSLVDCCWLAHDYIHGRGQWCSTMRNFGGWAGGASCRCG